MKKTILFLVIVALLVPAAALAQTEFSLGGFIKLDAFWDSTQEGKNMNTAIARNNDINFHHGRMKFTAQGSRFSFTIKGPKLWGATTTGFIEMDFDSTEEGATTSANTAANVLQRGSGTTASNSYTPRLRHAMFRLNWAETELLLGQYWSFFCEWWPEVAQDGPFQGTGIPTARLPQIRVTQKFLGDWTVAALIGESNIAVGNRTYSLVDHGGGESGETPQVQAKLTYQKDLWGKAAYYGKPTPFTAQVAAGWQRNSFGDAAFAGVHRPAFQQDPTAGGTLVVVNSRIGHTYQDPWLVNGVLFIPVLPTTSANLAGTASLLASWWIGQGVEAFGFAGITSQIYKFDKSFGNVFTYDTELQKRYGGYVQGQYYFNNQWFLTAAWAMSKAYGVSQSLNAAAPSTADSPGRQTAFLADQQKFWNEYNLCLWYRPIQAIKFGLQYSYGRTDWFQRQAAGAQSVNAKDIGEAHRVEFVGFFYF